MESLRWWLTISGISDPDLTFLAAVTGLPKSTQTWTFRYSTGLLTTSSVDDATREDASTWWELTRRRKTTIHSDWGELGDPRNINRRGFTKLKEKKEQNNLKKNSRRFCVDRIIYANMEKYDSSVCFLTQEFKELRIFPVKNIIRRIN